MSLRNRRIWFEGVYETTRNLKTDKIQIPSGWIDGTVRELVVTVKRVPQIFRRWTSLVRI